MVPQPWFSLSLQPPSPSSSKIDEKLSVAQAVKYMVPPQPATNARFSLLLLEFGEILLQDWAVVLTLDDSGGAQSKSKSSDKSSLNSNSSMLHSSTVRNHRNMAVHGRTESKSSAARSTLHLQGRLHLCTKSLVFEPDEPMRPILRFPFNKMDAPPRERGDDSKSATSSSLGDSYEFPLTIHFVSNRYWAMKENNKIGPYEMNYLSHVQITFLHSTPLTFVQLCKVSEFTWKLFVSFLAFFIIQTFLLLR